MASIEELKACERDVRALLKRAALPEPDEVEHGETCIRVLWHEPKAALVVQVDIPPDWEETELAKT